MRNFDKEKQQGIITVYLSLVLAVLIPLIFTVIEGSRISAMRLYLECVTDMGMDSVLAEYHRGLLEQYGLLFIDTSYGKDYGSTDLTADHMKEYMEYNLNPEQNLLLFGNRNLFGLQINSIDITAEARATDNGGEVFRHMAISYMLEYYGYSYIEELQDMISLSTENALLEDDIMAENDRAQEAIDGIVLPETEEGMEWQEEDIENPTEGVNELRSMGILSLVCQNTVSMKVITPSLYISHRNYVEGNGVPQEWEEYNSIADQLLFTEYIMKMCGCYTSLKENSLLDYQIEYILMGNANDADNLKGVVTRLLLIRGASNSLYFFSDQTLRQEARLMAEALALVVALPELCGIFEAAIIAAWIYAESLYDVRLLLQGEKIPLLKISGDWNLDLTNAMEMSLENMDSLGGHGVSDARGLSYEDYLRILLAMQSTEEKTFRCMDVVEMDIRSICGEENFCMDQCIAAADIQIIFESTYGYEFLVKRSCCYW